MIEWRDIAEMPSELAPGRSFLFCTLGRHIFHVTLVVRNGESLCWSTEGSATGAALLRDSDMAQVTHFAEPNLPEPSPLQAAAVAVRIANLDGRGLAYEHDRYGR
jgi:hypothetical protein